MSEFAKKLKELRKKNKITQKELANYLNVTQNAVFNWEKEKCEPNMDTLIKLANFFDVSIDYLTMGKVELLTKAWDEHIELENVTIEENIDDDGFKGILMVDGVLISDKKLLNEYHKLNRYGKKEAIKRVSELQYIPEYTVRDDIPFN